MVRHLLLLILPFVCASCGHKKVYVPRVAWTHDGMVVKPTKMPNELSLASQNMQYADIAVPLQATPVGYGNGGTTTAQQGRMIAFEVPATMQALDLFYAEHMESLGWQLIGRVQGAEWTIFFEKPCALCSVSLRPVHKNSKKVMIIIASNNKGSDIH